MVKELIAAGCDINLADKVKQMTSLALALACLGFSRAGRLAALAQTHAGGDASSISACSACVCLSSLTNIYIFVCMHTQIRMRIVIRVLTLVQSGTTPLQVAEEQGHECVRHASVATLIRNAPKLREEEKARAAGAAAAAAAEEGAELKLGALRISVATLVCPLDSAIWSGVCPFCTRVSIRITMRMRICVCRHTTIEI